jgi:hypothetical protein
MDLVLVDRGRGVVALDRRPSLGAHDARVVIGGVDRPGRRRRRGVRAGRSTEPPPVFHHPTRAIIRKELNARIRELRPVVREFERLERAAEALAREGARRVPALRSRVGSSPADRAAAAPVRGKGKPRSAATKPVPRRPSPARRERRLTP